MCCVFLDMVCVGLFVSSFLSVWCAIQHDCSCEHQSKRRGKTLLLLFSRPLRMSVCRYGSILHVGLLVAALNEMARGEGVSGPVC